MVEDSSVNKNGGGRLVATFCGALYAGCLGGSHKHAAKCLRAPFCCLPLAGAFYLTMKYTKEEKQKLIAFLKEDSENRIRRLEDDCLKLAKDSETKILRRLNNVSATLWNVQLKDVLMIERHHKPSIKHLISDIRAVQQELSFLSYNSVDNSMSVAANAGRSLRSVSDSRVSKPSRPQPKQRTASSRH